MSFLLLRLISFQDNWPKLEKWFNKFDILTKLDADTSTEDVHAQLKQILNDTVTKLAQTAEEERRRSEEALVQAAVEKEAEANKGIKYLNKIPINFRLPFLIFGSKGA